MEIKYQFFEKENLLIQKFNGVFSLKDYLSFSSHISKDISSETIKKVLIDFRDLSFIDNIDQIPDDFDERIDQIARIRKEINQNEHKNRAVTVIIWVDKPLPTVIAHLFVNNFSKMNYNYCSTVSKVIEMLKIDWHINNLETIVKNLENTLTNN
jgi:hypothetical protein